MKRRRYVGARGVVVVGALAITAGVGLPGGAASGSTSVVPRTMVGCWHRRVPALPVGTPAGVWLIKITPAGKLVTYRPGTKSCGVYSDFTATVSVAGSRLTIGSVPICPTKGVYTWKAAASGLTLHATADKSCSSRVLLFTGVWKKT
jgi:hypothetical protein